MSKRTFIIILVLASLSGICLEAMHRETPSDIEKPYVLNPASTDTLCISGIERAKNDSANGFLVFMNPHTRYVKELSDLCDQYGLKFRPELTFCIRAARQTQGCYRDYMDIILAKKFGSDFREKIKRQADSLFLIHALNDTTQGRDCDERPHLPNEEYVDDLPAISVSNLNVTGSPFMDFGFVVGTDSVVSSFYISHWVPVHAENDQLKDELFELAVNEMKTKYPKWVPGTIDSIPITTDNNVRLYFVKY